MITGDLQSAIGWFETCTIVYVITIPILFTQWAVGLLKKYQEINAEREKQIAAAKESGTEVPELPVPPVEGSIRERSIQMYQIQKQREAAEAGDPMMMERGKTIDPSKVVRMRVT